MSRPPLSRQRVIEAAARVADTSGLAGVSMRTVGREVGVEAMSLYHHVAGKEALLDGLADWVFEQVALPVAGAPWRTEMEARAHSARRVLAAHPWGLGLLESRRSPGPATLGHHDAVLGCLRSAGFTVALAAHAFSVLDAYTYGFVLTEVNLPFEPGESTEDFVSSVSRRCRCTTTWPARRPCSTASPTGCSSRSRYRPPAGPGGPRWKPGRAPHAGCCRPTRGA